MHTIKSKALVKSDKCLIMQPALITIVGKSAALLLQQIHYWVENQQTPGTLYQDRKWIANSYEDWQTDLKVLSCSTIKRSIKILKELGILLVEKLSPYKSNRTNWYSINYDRLAQVLKIALTESESPSRLEGQGREQQATKMTHCLDQNDPMVMIKKTNKEKIINHNKSEILKNKNLNQNPPLSKQMIDIWNQTINPEVKTELTKKRCQLLIAALKHKFKNNIQGWKEYCYKIASSDYLMGRINKSFKIALETVLKFDFIQRVQEKQFGVKEIPICHYSSENTLTEIKLQETSSEVKDARLKIYQALGYETYLSWFKSIKITVKELSIEFTADNIFKRDWLSTHYKGALEKILGLPVRIGATT